MIKLLRNFHIGRAVLASAEQSSLSKLRKKTGYTFANCKKALDMHGGDLNKAESWLQDQAQALGWSKASKVAGRATANGLVALNYDERHAVLVEINCETDFVARNEKFRTLAEEAAEACFHFAHLGQSSNDSVTKMRLDGERLSGLHGADKKTLADKVALAIGSLGENAVLRRAECWRVSPGLLIAAYTHPATPVTSCLSTGKYAGILAYRCDSPAVENDHIARKICQHIVGMNPSKIGTEGVDEPAKNVDDETCLIYQEFIADPTVKVNDVLKENNIKVVDFVRFECGQNLEAKSENEGEPLEHVQTCQ